MKCSSAPSPSSLSESAHQRLNMYALAASAAGVSLLALAPPSEAKIVHHQIGVALQGNSYYLFNPANQSVSPFSFVASFINRTSAWWNRVWVRRGSQYAGALLAKNQFVAEVQPGAEIGKGGVFGEGNSSGLLFTYGPYGDGTVNHHKGNCALKKTDYLGFKFLIAGKEHFGWVRMRVTIRPFPGEKVTVAYLRDFAYETIPGKSIRAGQTKSSDDTTIEKADASRRAPVRESATLGMLAVGAPALSIWRREDTQSVNR